MAMTGQATVATAGTAVQFTATAVRVKAVTVEGHPDNTGNVAWGDSSVSMTTGFVLGPGQSTVFYPRGPLSEYYVDAATNGDKLCWHEAD